MPTILFLFFSSQTADIRLSDNDTLQLSNSCRVQCLRQTQVNDWGGLEGPPGRTFLSSFLFFNVPLVPLLFKFRHEAVVRDKAAVSDHEVRSKYRTRPGSRACARTYVSSNTPSRLGLTRENRLCVNTASDLDLRWEGEEERWMEIWKKRGGGREKERERSGTEREGGVIFVVGAKKGGTEKQSLTFKTRKSGWRELSRSRPYLIMPGSCSLMAALFYTVDQYWNGVGNKCGRREGAADGYHRL